MINLITGTPGSGKTSYALKFLLDQLQGSKRKIYVHGIPDLKIPHEQVYCKSPTCDVCSNYNIDDIDPHLLVDQWHNYAPEGSVYFIDEAQNIYRPSASRSNLPESLKSFEVHRHKGLDFFLITQNPKLIHSNLCALVSRHIHLRPTWAGRFQYEWPECKNSLGVSDAIKSSYKLDKSTFDLYTSASIHTKQKRKIPFVFYALIFAFICVLLLSYRVYFRINERKVYPSVSSQDILPSGSVAKTTDGGLATEPLGKIIDNQEDKDKKPVYLDYYDLSIKSYSFVDPDDLDPDQCILFSSRSYKCSIPRSFVSRFQNSYCFDSRCYAYISYNDDSSSRFFRKNISSFSSSYSY